MSWHIENTDALTLLRELPDRWAQTCVTSPPRTGDPDQALAILTETRRVLRDDATLWILLTLDQLFIADELREDGWTQQPPPAWASCPGARLFLFSKRPRFFHTDTLAAPRGSLRAPCANATLQVRRAQTCLTAREHEQRLQLVKRCIRAGSSILACGECGAPYRRARPGENAIGTRRPTCAHNNPSGACLVLDPFYDRARIPTADAALCTGRSFLGITKPADASTGGWRR